MRFIIDIPDDNTTFNTVHLGGSLSLMEFRMRLESQECIPENNIHVSREYPPKAEEDTYADYWTHVESLASEIRDRCKDEDPDDRRHFDVSNALHEACDGSGWIIYYSSARKVLEHTRNDDALSDAGMEAPTGSLNDIIQTYAYWALEADVRDALEKLVDDINDPGSWFVTCAECGEEVADKDDLNFYDECDTCEEKREAEEAAEEAADAETPDHSDDDNTDTEKE